MFKRLSSVVVVMAVALVCGCSTMKPVEMPPEQVQQRISEGEIVEVGDTIKIATADDAVYKFKVTELTDLMIGGDGVDIPIDQVVAIETKEFSLGKTAAFAGGATVVWAIIVAAALGGTIVL